MSEALNALGEAVVSALPGAVTSHAVAYGELTITAQASEIVKVVTFLRDDARCRFTHCTLRNGAGSELRNHACRTECGR